MIGKGGRVHDDRSPLSARDGDVEPVATQQESPSRGISYDSVELYRDKVLPAIERRLQGVPPLMRLELLVELTPRAQSVLVLVGPRALLDEVGGAGVNKRLNSAQHWSVGSA